MTRPFLKVLSPLLLSPQCDQLSRKFEARLVIERFIPREGEWEKKLQCDWLRGSAVVQGGNVSWSMGLESLAGQNHSYHSDQASSIINPVAPSRKALMKPCSLTNIALLYRTAGSFLATLCYPSCCGHDGSGCRSHFPHLMIHDRSRPSTLRTRSPLLFAPYHQVCSSSHMMLKYYFPTDVRPQT